MINYNDGKWHAFDDYTNGVHDKSIVTVLYDNGTSYDCTMEYGNLFWTSWSGVTESGGIKTNTEAPVAFRVIKEHKEPRSVWMTTDGYIYLSKTQACIISENPIEFREVLP